MSEWFIINSFLKMKQENKTVQLNKNQSGKLMIAKNRISRALLVEWFIYYS